MENIQSVPKARLRVLKDLRTRDHQEARARYVEALQRCQQTGIDLQEVLTEIERRKGNAQAARMVG